MVEIGQVTHQVTSRMTIWSAGYSVRSIAPLEEEKALKQGAEFVGESVVFLISGGWLVYEYQQSVEKARAKEESNRKQAESERKALKLKLTSLEERLASLEGTLHNTKPVSLLNLNDTKDPDEDAKKKEKSNSLWAWLRGG